MDANIIYSRLNIDADLLNAALDIAHKERARLERFVAPLFKGKTGKTKKLDPIEKLALVLSALPQVFEKYTLKGIPEQIFFDTFSDIKIWCDNAFEQYKKRGLVNIRWIAKHLSMKIFRIGRLQYEFSRFAILPHAKIGNVLKCPYRIGEKCVTLHIPQGEKLDNDACIKSLEEANAFFAKYYPDYKYRCYTVITWLLNPDLENVLGKDSNIVRFGKMFTLLGYVPDSDMNERRVFGYAKDRANYIADNALRKYTLDRIKNGKPLYSYNGFRDK